MYTMMQVCSEVDMTYQTLKYYCNEGLVTHVKRDKNNRRIFDEHGVKWIKDLSCLKRCSFSIQKMKDYLDLCLEGESTVKIRKEFLVRKREHIQNHIFFSFHLFLLKQYQYIPTLYSLISQLYLFLLLFSFL